jgi:hypothetical protein
MSTATIDEILTKHGAEPGELTEALKRDLTQLIADIIGPDEACYNGEFPCTSMYAPSAGCDCGAAPRTYERQQARQRAKERGIKL